MFKLKTRLVNVTENFKGSKSSQWCQLCFLFYESQEHLRNCFVIKERLGSKSGLHFEYGDIDGPLHLQENFAKCYTIILTTREELLQELTPNGDHSTGGTFHDAANRDLSLQY